MDIHASSSSFLHDENLPQESLGSLLPAKPPTEHLNGEEGCGAGGEDELAVQLAEDIVNEILGVRPTTLEPITSQTSTVVAEDVERSSSQETLCGTEEQQSDGDLMKMEVQDSPMPPFLQPAEAEFPRWTSPSSPWSHFPPSQHEPTPAPAAASPQPVSSSFPIFDSLDECAKALLQAVQENDLEGKGAARKDKWFKALLATFGSARVDTHLTLLEDYKMLELKGGKRGVYCLAQGGLPLLSLPPPAVDSPPHLAAAQAQPQAKAKGRGRGRGRGRGGVTEEREETEEREGEHGAGQGQGREEEGEWAEEGAEEEKKKEVPPRKRPRANANPSAPPPSTTISSSTNVSSSRRGGVGVGGVGGVGGGGRQHYPIPKSAPPPPQGRRSKSARKTRAAAAHDEAMQSAAAAGGDLRDEQGLLEMMACTDVGEGLGWFEQEQRDMQGQEEQEEQEEQARPMKHSLAQHLRMYSQGHSVFLSDSVPAAPKAKAKAKAKVIVGGLHKG